ncbi:MAG: sensor domain-containing diguanylate cyclase [Spirochaetota bacterium]
MSDDYKPREKLLKEIAELRAQIDKLKSAEDERDRAEYELGIMAYELKERVKELNCLFSISTLLEDQGKSLEEIIQNIVDLIPAGWPLPEITYARAVIEKKEYKTSNYQATDWKEACPVMINGEPAGTLEIGYSEALPKVDEGYFFKEERQMLLTLAEQMGRIIERKRTEEQLKYYATVDAMTGILNRRTGLTILEQQMKLSRRYKAPLSLIFVDANNLKYVNDTFSHKEGDELIILISRLLSDSIRSSDTVCRMGGDEFLIIFPGCGLAEAEKIWVKITRKINDLNAKNEKPYPVSLSHGIAEHTWEKDESLEELLAQADNKMYAEKNAYKTQI